MRAKGSKGVARMLGELAWVAPFVFLVLFLLSWRFPSVNSISLVAATAITYSLCAVLYAHYTSVLLAMRIGGL